MAERRVEHGVTVQTTAGTLVGDAHRGVQVFRGVPYAAPPVGALRFRPPQPIAPWAGARDARSFGPMAPQNPSALEAIAGNAPLGQSEDCLTLNVWTPQCDDAKRPVMVWIHGGGFTTGTAASPWYSGTNMALQGDVVIVTANYRLGALGFTHLADLGGEAWASSANCGILDQVAALTWVHDNIAAFGGDPDNVTIFGESAGGCSVVTLLATPSAKGLFHKAIAQSASCGQVRTREGADERAALLLADLGIDAAHLELLAEVPLEKILDAQARLSTRRTGRGFSGVDMQAFSPAPDGTSLLEMPLDAIAAGSSADIPVIVGTNRDEIKLFAVWDVGLQRVDREGAVTRLQSIAGDRAAALYDAYAATRVGQPASEVAMAIASDETFRLAALQMAEAQHAVGASAYTYLFTWPSPALDGRLGACHALEIPFVFDNVHQPGVEMLTGDGDDRAPLAKVMNAAWTAFARTGSPDHGAMPAWPTYDPTRRGTMVFDIEVGVVDDPLGADRRAWSEHMA
jgi:para-nitrobenzyl esterase